MIPFRIQFRAGVPVFEQAVYAATRAIVSGQLRPGDAFPSVRTLSRELKINPNTAHKVITQLLADGLLEVHPGIGTVVAQRPSPSAEERTALLGPQMEALVVEARRLSLSLDEMQEAMASHWRQLSPNQGEKE